MSAFDSRAHAARLETHGAEPAEDLVPDVVLIQTCSVTDRADRDGRRALRRLRRENPRATLVATGCLAQRDPEGLARLPDVDLVLGHGLGAELPRLLAERASGLLPGKIAWSPAPARGDFLDVPLPFLVAEGRTRAFLKIQDGCERRCAFCIIPSLRGIERSELADRVVDSVLALSEAGIPEIVLTGIHLANFGGGVEGPARRQGGLVGLLRRLEDAAPRARVRLSSLEPMEAGEELVDLVSTSRVVVPHLHLPAQAGSDSVLRRMRRGLVTARYRALVLRAERANPRLHLATDVITGFPGETAAEAAESEAFFADLPLASLHVFPFSSRSGTDAARWAREDGVPDATITRRASRLRALACRKLRDFARAHHGTVADSVVLKGGRALTDNYLDAGYEGGAPAGSRFDATLSVDGDGRVRVAAERPEAPC
ncbi:MAG: MiaB/RimO family radical SAM methylthiotransferase [Acidobacteria bacterium]|nr:MiaB/RimO family radical SAM methylthiotransferase [Acidobacteriota bacterium]